MKPFRPAVAAFRGEVPVPAGPEEAFPLFSPEGERRWVPGWDPEILHPAGGDWREGQIFRTREAKEEAVWIVTRLDPARRQVEYHRVEPGRYVARIEVGCVSAAEGETRAEVVYSFIGLSEEGNREIEAMTQEEYQVKMKRWTAWIKDCLAFRPAGPQPAR
jgi:hypothetical protein